MKIISFILVSLFTYSAQASIAELFSNTAVDSICNSVVQANTENAPLFASGIKGQNIYVAQRKYNNTWFIAEINKEKPDQVIQIAEFADPIFGLKYSKDKLWVLQRSTVSVIHSQTGELSFVVNTNSYGGNHNKHQRAYDLDIYEGRVYIAHGAYGLVVIDERNGKIILTESFGLDSQPNGHKSKAMSISISDKAAILGIDNITQPTNAQRALNGLIKFNPLSPKKHTKHQYDPKPNKAGVIAYARMQLEGAKLFINNLGNLQLFETSSLGKTIVPTWRRLSVEMHGRDRNIRPIGELLVENDKVYGCGSIYLGDIEGKPDLVPFTIR